MPTFCISVQEEKRAIEMAGKARHDLVTGYGFQLVELTNDAAIYQDSSGYQVRLQAHKSFCKPPNDKEFEVCGYIDLWSAISPDGRVF